MKLLDEIIALAADGSQPLANVLRKCLILAFDLKNDKLKQWVEKELNGFEKDDDLPPYRVAGLHSKGNFSGGGGAWIPQRPLPLGVLDPKHREFISTAKFVQPIAAYDSGGSTDEKHNAIIPWPPDLIARYQAKFMPGYALSQAWQELPASVLIGLCEEVRNRVLRFALEIREELSRVDTPASVPADRIEAAVVNHIYGGTNIIGGSVSNVTQVGNLIVNPNDFTGLTQALQSLGISQEHIDRLRHAIDTDHHGFGATTKAWLKEIGGKIGNAGLTISVAAAQELAKRWLLQYFDLN